MAEENKRPASDTTSSVPAAFRWTTNPQLQRAAAPFFALDAIELFGRHSAPGMLNNFACTIEPYLKISILFVPRYLMDYAHTQCLTQSAEPTPSIIFFMLKITMILALSFILGAWRFLIPAFILPPHLQQLQSKQRMDILNDIKKDGGFIASLKTVPPILLGLGLLEFYLLRDFDKRPDYFSISFIAKVQENLTCLCVFAFYALFVGYIVGSIAYGQKTIPLFENNNSLDK